MTMIRRELPRSSSASRRHVLHQPSDLESPLLASPLAGGAARELAPCVNSFRSFTVGRTGIYFLGCGAPEAPLHHLDPATGRIRVLGRIPTQTGGDGFAVSPDGQTVLHPRRSGGLERNLVMIENFR